MVCAGLDVDGATFVHRDLLALNLEGSAASEHYVDLVPLVRLLTVRLRRHEDVDAELHAVGLMDDLVSAVAGLESPSDLEYVEGPGKRHRHRQRDGSGLDLDR